MNYKPLHDCFDYYFDEWCNTKRGKKKEKLFNICRGIEDTIGRAKKDLER